MKVSFKYQLVQYHIIILFKRMRRFEHQLKRFINSHYINYNEIQMKTPFASDLDYSINKSRSNQSIQKRSLHRRNEIK